MKKLIFPHQIKEKRFEEEKIFNQKMELKIKYSPLNIFLPLLKFNYYEIEEQKYNESKFFSQ